MSFEDIVREGTSVRHSLIQEDLEEYMRQKDAKPSNVITCADGFTLSAIAGEGAYCSPRPGWFGGTPDTYAGPYHQVEVGFPSERPEPWSEWEEHCENAADPTNTVYGYVPVDMVRAFDRTPWGRSVSAPKLVESISTVTAPVKIESPRMSRGSFLVGVITGGVLAVADVALMVVGITVAS